MRVHEGLDALAELDLAALHGEALEGRSVVTIGVFDGVHLGHQRLLHELHEMASELRGLATVVTFEDHPDRLLRGSAPPPITSLAHRLRLLRRAGVGRVAVLKFDERLREMDAAEFAERVLARGLRTRGLLLGHDSAIGRDREGTPERLRALGREHGFAVREAAPFLVDGQRVSSTAIRSAIQRGDLALSHRLLGRWPSAFGMVQKGEGRGVQLGFPTANLVPDSQVMPPHGVYAVQVLHDGEPFAAVANLGVRPTFPRDGAPPLLEVHLLDWTGDLYGHRVEVAFVQKLRDEKRFAGVPELKAQIAEDARRAREVFAS